MILPLLLSTTVAQRMERPLILLVQNSGNWESRKSKRAILDLCVSGKIYSPGTDLGDGIGYRWKARDRENRVGGEPSPSPGSLVFAASLLRHEGGHCHGGGEHFHFSVDFLG